MKVFLEQSYNWHVGSEDKNTLTILENDGFVWISLIPTTPGTPALFASIPPSDILKIQSALGLAAELATTKNIHKLT